MLLVMGGKLFGEAGQLGMGSTLGHDASQLICERVGVPIAVNPGCIDSVPLQTLQHAFKLSLHT